MNLDNDFRKFDYLFNSINDVIWSVDYLSFKIQFINKAAEKLLGISQDEIYAHEIKWEDIIHKDDLELAKTGFEKLLKNGKNSTEYRIINKSGEVRHVSESSWVIYDTQGNPDRIEGVTRDITEQRLVEDEFFKGKELYNTLIENLPGFAIALFNPSLKVVYSEGLLLKESGLTSENILNKPIKKILKKFSSESIPDIKNVFKGESFKFETLHLSNFYDISFSPLKNKNGRIGSGILIIQDVSESKLYANSVVRSILQTQDTQNNQIAFNIHEDLGQMIYGIKLQLEKLEKNEEYLNKYKEDFHQIKHQICSAITQIKDLSKELSPSHVEDFGLEDTLPNLCAQTERKGKVKISFHQDINTKKFNKDFEISLYRFFQEMFEVLVNKQHATAVSIYIYEKNGCFNLKITNNGTGFDKNLIEDNHKLEARINALNGNYRLISGIENETNKIFIQIPVAQVATH